jgi:glycosyltransferase involved in cell wall biosynthesis
MRVAYLVSRYPLVSHTFITREVQALRRLGVDVYTFSIRRTPEQEVPAQQQGELATTVALRPLRATALIAAHLRALARAPSAYAAAIADALHAGTPGLRGRLWQLFYFGQAIVLARECEARDIAHVHAHHANVASDVAMIAAAYGRRTRAKLPRSWSFTLHGPTEFDDPERFRPGIKADHADLVVCISEYCRDQLSALASASARERMHVVHCGVDPSMPGRFNGRPVASAGRAYRILNVAQMAPRKGQRVLLEALAGLVDRGRDVEAVLVGDGPDRAEIERLANEGPLAGRVRLTGALGESETLALYADADAFCLTSFAEGLPVVLMEALAAGLPAVATRIMGVPELVEEGQTGLLVAPGRPDEVADALERLMDDRDLAERLGANGRARVAAEFDVNRSAERLRDLFRPYC